MKNKAPELVPFEAEIDGRRDDIPERPMTPLEAASFIESMSAELRAMARGAKLDALAYFLEMVRLEASTEVVRLAGLERKPGPAGEDDGSSS